MQIFFEYFQPPRHKLHNPLTSGAVIRRAVHIGGYWSHSMMYLYFTHLNKHAFLGWSIVAYILQMTHLTQRLWETWDAGYSWGALYYTRIRRNLHWRCLIATESKFILNKSAFSLPIKIDMYCKL